MSETWGTVHDPVRVMKRALKCASKDYSREILTCVHLDASGDVVSTDSYRMFISPGSYDGDSVDVPREVAEQMAKGKASQNETAKVRYAGGKVIVKMGDGRELASENVDAKYPKYGAYKGGEYGTVAHVKPKMLTAILNHLVKTKDEAVLGVWERTLRISGRGGEMPEGRFDKACDGEDVAVAFNAKFLREALGVFGSNEPVEIRIAAATKPVTITDGNDEVILMPVYLGAGDKPKSKYVKDERKETDMAKKDETKQEQPLNLKGETVCITGALPSMTRSAAFTKLKLAGGTPAENFTGKVTVLVTARGDKTSKRKKADAAIAKGQEVRMVSGAEFEAALEAAFTAPVKPVTPPPVKNEPKPEKPAAPKPPKADERKEQELELRKRIEELEAELSKRSAELERVWKENEHLKAAKPEPKEQEAAATVSLESMQKWCEGKGLVASQKREGTCIWVEGESTPYRDELVDMGFRFAKKRKSWYFNPAA